MKNRILAGIFLGVALTLGVLAAGCGKEKTLSENLETGQTEISQEETGSQNQAGSQEQAGQPALKSFQAETLDGKTFTQEDISEKDATLINFWSVSCSPCVSEMPDIAELEKSLPDNVQIITVCLDGRRGAESAAEILTEAGFEGATLISADGDLLDIVGEIIYMPTTIVVDQDGNLVGDAIIGGQKNLEEVFTGAINEALRSTGKTEIGNGEE